MVERSKSIELFQSQYEGLRWRRVHKIKMDQVVDPKTLEHQYNSTKVGTLDLSVGTYCNIWKWHQTNSPGVTKL